MKRYTIDTSVIVASFLSKEINHSLAKKEIKRVFNEECEIILPVTVLVEIASAIIRRTKDKTLARNSLELITSHSKIKIVELDFQRTVKSIETSFSTNLRTLDSILLQVSREFNSELITFDEEILSKLKMRNLIG